MIEKLKRSALLHYLVLAVFIMAAYWPLSSFSHTTRWDSVDSYFPFRYFLSDCLRNGELPLWLPYQLGGYPFYADPQSGAWYPVAWIIGSLAPYTLRIFAIEFLLTIFIGGAGMYRLVKSFDADARIALIAGISFSACGFFISGAEYITWVVSAAWLPWIFWSYHRMAVTGKYGYALLAALFLFMLLSGGYPAFMAVAIYLLAAFFLALMFRKQPASARWKLIGLHLVLVTVFLVISSGVLLSWFQARSIISRGAALSLEAINVGPFSPRCLESLILPFVTLKGDEVYRTDVSMRNAYIGICCLVMIPFAVGTLRKSRKLQMIAIASIVCLAAALGPYLPVREWLYDFVPGMRLFRLPAFFRIFFIIGAVLIASIGIGGFLKDIPTNRRILAWMLGILIAALGLLFIYSVLKHGVAWGWGSHGYDASGRSKHVQLQSLLQIGMLGFLLSVCLYRGGRHLTYYVLLGFCMVDMVLASGLNAYGTVAYRELRADMEAPILNAPRHFPVPDNLAAVSATGDTVRKLGLLRTNTSIYFKTPVPDGYNSFLLNSFNRLSASKIKDSVWSNPYLYFADGLSAGNDTMPLRSRAALRLDTADFFRLSRQVDFTEAVQHIQVTSFRPNQITAEVRTSHPALLNLQQNYVEGWRMAVDGKPVSIIRSNLTQMAGIIPEGTHQVVWTFNPPYIRAMILLTLVSLLLLIAVLIGFGRRLLETNSG